LNDINPIVPIPNILGNVVYRVRLSSFMARRDDATWPPPPVKRSNAAMDEKGRVMDAAFPSILGIKSQ